MAIAEKIPEPCASVVAALSFKSPLVPRSDFEVSVALLR